jgi:hypothetical protein
MMARPNESLAPPLLTVNQAAERLNTEPRGSSVA